METNYDEDLNENVFFQMFHGEHKELFQKATAEGWVVCVPRAGSLPKYALTDNDIYSHILVPSDELPESHFRSLNGKDIRICNRVVTVEQDDISRPYSTHILFEETFYTDDFLKYKVLCVESPLDRQSEPGQVSDTGIVTVNTLQDCIDLLWTESSGKDVLEQMDDAITNFLKDNEGVELEPLQKQRDQTSALYSRCLQIALRDTRLREKTTVNKHLLQNVKIAVETYLHHGIYHVLIKGVTACTAYEDAALNKIIRNVSDLQLRDLGVRSDLYDTVPKAKQELARIDRYSTVLGKIGCIKKTLASISRTRPGEDPSKGNIIAADDLLPMMVFLVIKASLANWIAHLTVMKTFRFSASASSQTDEASFLITSLEAAVEHVKSGVLLGPSEPEAHWAYESVRSEGSEDDFEILSTPSETIKLEARSDLDPSSIAYLFDQIRVGNLEEVINVLDNGSKQPKKEIDSSLSLCHPLCSCDKCEGLLSKVLCVTTPTIHSCDDRGFTALHVASLYGQPQIVDLLLMRGASVNVTDYSGSTPLHYAASRGHQNALLLLAHSDAEIQSRDNEGNAPLHLSAGNGHEGCVKALLYFSEHVGVRLDVNATNTNGDTALHHAARWGYEGIVSILLEYGANPNIENKRKLTASHYAHNLHVSRLLSNALTNKTSVKSLEFLKKSPKLQSDMSIAAVHKEKLDFSDDHETCSLNGSLGEHSSIRPHNTEQIKRVEKLLRAISVGDTRLACYYLGLEGPEESLQSNEGYNVVMCHPLCTCENCRPKTLDSKAGGTSERVTLNVNVSNSEGFTPLHIAAMNGQADMMRLLLDSGAYPNVRTRQKGLTPLHLACQHQRVAAARILTQTGECNLDLQDLRGNTALHHACFAGNAKLVELMVKEGATVDVRNSEGKRPVDDAEEKMSLSVIRLLKIGKTLSNNV